MSRIKGKLTTADYLPIEEFNLLVDSLRQDKEYIWELYCRVSFYTTLRASDVLSLTWEDILNNDVFCKIEKKTGKSRKIPLNKSVRKKISEIYTLLGEPNIKGSLFLNPNSKKTYSLEHVNRRLKQFRVKYRLSIKAFSTHTFRKTFGRYVYESNNKSAESLILLNSIFRHSSIDITKVYIGLRQAEIDQVFNSINF